MNKTTKKILGLTTATALCLSQISAFATENTVSVPDSTDKVYFNGNISDITLKNKDGRNLIPLRAISELMDASVYWLENDKNEQSIQIVSGDRMIRYAIDTDYFTVYSLSNGTFNELETLSLPNNVAPRIMDDEKTYIPLRAAIVTLLTNTPGEINDDTLADKPIETIRGKFTYSDGRIDIKYNSPTDTDYVKIADVKSDEKYLNETYRIKGRLEWDTDKWKVSDGKDSYISFKDPSVGVLDEQLRINGKVYDANGLTVVMTGFASRDEGQSESYLKLSRATASLRPVTAKLSIDGDKNKFSYSVESIKGDDKSVSSEKLPVGTTVDIKANEDTNTNKFKVYYNGEPLTFENGTAHFTVAEGEDANKLEIKEESVNVELAECFEPVTDLNNLKVNNKIEFKVKDGYIVSKDKKSMKLNLSVNGEPWKVDSNAPYLTVTSRKMEITAEWIKVDKDKTDSNIVKPENIDYIDNHVKFAYDKDLSAISLNGKANSLEKDPSGHYAISVDPVASGTTVSITAPTAAPEKANVPTADNTETKAEDNTEGKTDETAATPDK